MHPYETLGLLLATCCDGFGTRGPEMAHSRARPERGRARIAATRSLDRRGSTVRMWLVLPPEAFVMRIVGPARLVPAQRAFGKEPRGTQPCGAYSAASIPRRCRRGTQPCGVSGAGGRSYLIAGRQASKRFSTRRIDSPTTMPKMPNRMTPSITRSVRKNVPEELM